MALHRGAFKCEDTEDSRVDSSFSISWDAGVSGAVECLVPKRCLDAQY